MLIVVVRYPESSSTGLITVNTSLSAPVTFSVCPPSVRLLIDSPFPVPPPSVSFATLIVEKPVPVSANIPAKRRRRVAPQRQRRVRQARCSPTPARPARSPSRSRRVRLIVAFPSALFAVANSVPLVIGSVVPASALATFAFKNPLFNETPVLASALAIPRFNTPPLTSHAPPASDAACSC